MKEIHKNLSSWKSRIIEEIYETGTMGLQSSTHHDWRVELILTITNLLKESNEGE